MNLTPYVESVRAGVVQAAALADDHTRYVADQLGSAIESSTRLALIQALSDAAATISSDLAPSSVEVRMAGADPEFAVSVAHSDAAPTLLVPEADPEATNEIPAVELDDEPVARISLRLPQSVKSRVDERADADGISTNAWLIAAVLNALASEDGPPRRTGSETFPFFGPHGPFGENGVFGPNGPFGSGRRPDQPHDPRPRGNVQGWVR